MADREDRIAALAAEVETLVETIVAQQIEIFELVGEDERQPLVHPPVDADALRRLRQAFVEAGAEIPLSWEAFLRVCDGITDFSLSYHLHGADVVAEGMRSGSGCEVCAGLVGETRADGAGLVLVGSHEETTTRLCLDLAHEPLETDEAVVLDGDPGFASLHVSFIASLRMRVEANRITIARLSGGVDERADDDEE